MYESIRFDKNQSDFFQMCLKNRKSALKKIVEYAAPKLIL